MTKLVILRNKHLHQFTKQMVLVISREYDHAGLPYEWHVEIDVELFVSWEV